MIEEIPQHWQETLLQLQRQDPTTIIAGGAIRDLFCGRPVKDVDFFCTNHSTYIQGKIGMQSTKDYEGMQYIQGILDFPDEVPPMSLIFHDCPDPLKLIESFDFGICQIGWTGTELIKTSAFDWDFKHGVMTLRRGDRYERALERYNRISKKYDWPLAVGEGVVIEKQKDKMELF